MRTRRSHALVLAIALGLARESLGLAAEEQAGGPTPPRVSFLDGEVSFWRPGAEDWAPAKVNTPLAPGDALYVGDRGNMEVQLAPRAFVRAAAGTQVGLDPLEHNFGQFKVTA